MPESDFKITQRKTLRWKVLSKSPAQGFNRSGHVTDFKVSLLENQLYVEIRAVTFLIAINFRSFTMNCD